jgi:predicted  nucleic acid-binding Zn-ribbon protein
MPYDSNGDWYDIPDPQWRLDANGNWLAPDGSLSDVVTAYASDPEYVKSILGATYGQNTNPSFQNPYASSEQANYDQTINTLQNAGINVTNDPLFQSNAQEQLSYDYSPFMNADAPTHSPVDQIVQGIALAGLGAVAGPEVFGALGGAESAVPAITDVAPAVTTEVASPLASLPAEVPLPIEPTPIAPTPVEAPIPQPSPLEAYTPPAQVTPPVVETPPVNTVPQQALDDLIAKQQMLYPTIGNTTIGLPQVGSSVLSGAGKGAVTSALADLTQGKPITLQDVATGALTGGVGGGAGNLATQFGGGAIGAGIAGGATGSATGALINGGDVGSSALKGALTGGISGATSDLLQGLPDPVIGAGKSVANTLTNAITSGNTNNLGTNLVTGALGSAGLTAVNSVIPPLSSILPTQQTTPPLNTLSTVELNAINNPYDTSQYPTFNPVVNAPTGITQDTVLPNQSPLSVENLPNVTDNSPSGIYNNPVGETTNVGQTPLNPVVDNPDGTQSVKLPDGTVNTYDANDVLVSSTPPNTETINQPTNNVVDFSPINNQLSELSANQQGLSGTVGGIQSTLGNLTNQLTANQDNTNQQIANLTTEQQKAVANQVAMGVDLNSAIANVKQSLGDTNAQIANNQTQNNTQFGQINNQLGVINSGLNNTNQNLSTLEQNLVKQLTDQGMSTQDAINKVANNFGSQVNDLSNTVASNQDLTNTQLQNLNTQQQETVKQLTEQGLTTQDAIQAVTGNVNNLSNSVNDVKSSVNTTNQNVSNVSNQVADLSTKYDNLNDSQKAIFDQLTQQGVSANNAINAVQQGLNSTNTNLSNLGNQVNDLTNQGTVTLQGLDDLNNQVTSNQNTNQNSFSDINTKLADSTAQEKADFEKLSSAQQDAVRNQMAMGDTLGNSINSVQKGLDATNSNIVNMGNQFGNQIGNLTGVVGGLGTQINDTNTNLNNKFGDLSNQVNSNQIATDQKLANLTTAQQKQVADAVAQGQDLTQAISDVEKNLTQTIDENQASNVKVINGLNSSIGTLQSSVDSTNANNALSSLYNSQYKQPTEVQANKPSTPTSLYTGDLLKNTDILQKLKGMYPQLNQVSPQILAKLGYQTESPLQSHTESMGLTQANPYEHLLNQSESGFKDGGHVPEFITGHTGHYAEGKGDGQSDDIKALLNEGDYVMDAEAVAQLGNGSSKAGKSVLEQFRKSMPQNNHKVGGKVPAMIADGEYVLPSAFVSSLGKGDGNKGAEMLDNMRHALRDHKRSAPLNKIPPPSKSPLEYLRDGSKMKEKR